MASILSELDLHPCLRNRMHSFYLSSSSTTSDGAKTKTFILYLPTVCLRYEQNPSFALACHAANHFHVPLVVLAVVVDDASHACVAHPHRFPPSSSSSSNMHYRNDDNDNVIINSDNIISPSSAVVMTSRRLAFTLQALSHACNLWSEHGAAVGIRIHSYARGGRTPDHLTLASRSSLVVTDEPFVSPYTTFVRRVEEACRKCNVECIRVDGSCTVPPLQVLKKRMHSCSSKNDSSNQSCNKILYDGVPNKAYAWQNKTEHLRESHLAAAREGYFDAPKLIVCMEDDDLFIQEVETSTSSSSSSIGIKLAHLFPHRWKRTSTDDDDVQHSNICIRPYTSCELSKLHQSDSHVGGFSPETEQQPISIERSQKHHFERPFHNFALNWPGADPTVPPCSQTIGTTPYGMRRWDKFVQSGGLRRYGKERNDPRLVHSVSRMSAYLNLGIVSIFALVSDVKHAQKTQKLTRNGNKASNPSTKDNNRWNKSGADKFEEEIVKWREMSYAHAFSREDYDDVGSLPQWSVSYLNNSSFSGVAGSGKHTLQQLANGMTGDIKWDAMQKYLVRTGELHNNVRMTWGKTVVEWLVSSVANGRCCSPLNIAQFILRTLCYLNDRYALDGLSPPSYAGILWCMGWTDKPSSGGSGNCLSIKFKPAHLYRWNQDDFRVAEKKLLAPQSIQDDEYEAFCGSKRKLSVLDMIKTQARDRYAIRTDASAPATDT